MDGMAATCRSQFVILIILISVLTDEYRAQYSADWGDYISFAHHLRQRADDDGSDLLVVDTGDRVEGNGLYDA